MLVYMIEYLKKINLIIVEDHAFTRQTLVYELKKIEEFFVENTPILIQKSEVLAKKGQYEDAVSVLSLIPESVSCD